DIDNIQELEVQLCEFFAVAEKDDGSLYLVNSLLAAIQAINRFYNSNISKIKPVNLLISRDTPEGLLYQVFKKRKEEGFNVYIYKSKTNQHGLDNLGTADKISIPANNSIIIENYEKYFLKKPVNTNSEFYLHLLGTKSAPETSELLLDIQNSQSNMIPVTDSYNQFRSAKQIYQVK
ncbi:8061_t:CDS:2, partial [Racocetra persica]